jgi:crotonobetainyl-CoA:carnitine CoA-transferase CaiB-like acyl-CoA transferase
MKTNSSNQRVVPQGAATLDKSGTRYGAFMIPAALVKRSDPKTQDAKAVRYGAFMTPQACRR